MPVIDRWPVEMQDVQSALAWLVPDAETARNLVSEAEIPPGFIDFGEPLWNRIKRIMVEAEKREMMPALLTVITKWYPENPALKEAKAAWEAGEDRKAAAALLRKAAKEIPHPVATATVTRKGDVVTDVAVDVTIPEVEDDMEVKILEVEEAEKTSEPSTESPMSLTEEPPVEIPYSDELQPGDWFSTQKTQADFERRIGELEKWRQQMSIMPTPEARKP